MSRGLIRAFFQYERKVEAAKEQLHMDVRMGETTVDTDLSICWEFAS